MITYEEKSLMGPFKARFGNKSRRGYQYIHSGRDIVVVNVRQEIDALPHDRRLVVNDVVS